MKEVIENLPAIGSIGKPTTTTENFEMKNPIGNVGLFHTPDNMEALEAWLEGTSKATQAGPYIVTAAMMAWNLAGKYVEKNLAADAEAKKALEYNTPATYRARMNG